MSQPRGGGRPAALPSLSAEEYARIIDSAMDAIVTVDGAQRIVLFNPGAERMFRCRASEVLGQPLDRFLPGPFRAAHRRHIQRFATTSTTTRRMGELGEVIGVRASGEEFPVEASISQTAAPEPHFTAVLRDVTERRRAEHALRTREQELRQSTTRFVEAQRIARIGSFELHSERGVLYRSPELNRIFEFAPGDASSFDAFMARVHADDLEMTQAALQRAFSTAEDFYLTCRITVPSGATKHIRALGTVTRDADGPAALIIGTVQDITEAEQQAKKLREQEHLAHIGRMAAVVAHEVKNPLAGVQGVLQILRQRATLSQPDQAIIDNTRDRLSNLTYWLNEVLTYARPPMLTLGPTLVPDLIRNLLSTTLTDPVFQHIKVDCSIEQGLPPVVADAGQLERVFSNLVLNAAQAMKGRGRLELTAQAGASTIQITIHDSGPGIPDDIRENVFEPFFTTRSRGTGLGLAICRQIVTAHHGDVRVACPPSGGTLVSVSLPLANG